MQEPSLIFPTPYPVNTGVPYWDYGIINDAIIHYSDVVPCSEVGIKVFSIYLIELENDHAGSNPAPAISIQLQVSPFEADVARAWVSSPGTPGPLGQGDVNADGVVDTTDLTLIGQIIAGAYIPTAAEFARADVNGDGVVDVVDLTGSELLMFGVFNPVVSAPLWTVLTVTISSFSDLGTPTVVVPSNVYQAQQAINMWFEQRNVYARLAIQAAAVVAGASWWVKAYYGGGN